MMESTEPMTIGNTTAMREFMAYAMNQGTCTQAQYDAAIAACNAEDAAKAA